MTNFGEYFLKMEI